MGVHFEKEEKRGKKEEKKRETATPVNGETEATVATVDLRRRDIIAATASAKSRSRVSAIHLVWPSFDEALIPLQHGLAFGQFPRPVAWTPWPNSGISSFTRVYGLCGHSDRLGIYCGSPAACEPLIEGSCLETIIRPTPALASMPANEKTPLIRRPCTTKEVQADNEVGCNAADGQQDNVGKGHRHPQNKWTPRMPWRHECFIVSIVVCTAAEKGMEKRRV